MNDKTEDLQSCWIEFMALKWILDSKYGALRLPSAVDDYLLSTDDDLVQYYRASERTIELKCYPVSSFLLATLTV